MEVIENPLKYLIPIFITIIILLILFKFNNWVDERKVSDKKPKAEAAKTADAKSEAKEVAKLAEVKEETNQDIVVVNSNYLYDRFVTNPTEDDLNEDDSVNSAFLTEEEALKIRDRRTEIKVGDVVLSEKELLYKKIEAMKNENLALKDKLLSEFNSLSKEMKLMLLENIIQHMD